MSFFKKIVILAYAIYGTLLFSSQTNFTKMLHDESISEDFRVSLSNFVYGLEKDGLVDYNGKPAVLIDMCNDKCIEKFEKVCDRINQMEKTNQALAKQCLAQTALILFHTKQYGLMETFNRNSSSKVSVSDEFQKIFEESLPLFGFVALVDFSQGSQKFNSSWNSVKSTIEMHTHKEPTLCLFHWDSKRIMNTDALVWGEKLSHIRGISACTENAEEQIKDIRYMLEEQN